MWIYPVRLGILILGGLRLISPCPKTLPGRQAIIAILRSGPQGSNCRSFLFCRVPVLTVCSTTELLDGYSRGQFSRHWSGS